MTESSTCLWIVVIGAVLFISFIVIRAFLRWQAIREAAQNYNANLVALRRSPTNSSVREQTLAAGRVYARAARDGGKETLFDEVSLMNDINAIAGASVSTNVPQPHPPPPKSSAQSLEERFLALDDLKRKGLINEDEYQDRRSKIIDEI